MNHVGNVAMGLVYGTQNNDDKMHRIFNFGRVTKKIPRLPSTCSAVSPNLPSTCSAVSPNA
jgi:hypothetical protein